MLSIECKLDGDKKGDGTALTPTTGRIRFCKQCKFSCTSSIAFLHHQFVTHGDKKSPKKSEVDTVAVDGNEAHTDGNQLVHASENKTLRQLVHSGNVRIRNYSCKMCTFTTLSSKKYLAHERDNHNVEFVIHECDLCDYATKYKTKLTRHRQVHFRDSNSQLNQSDSDTNNFKENVSQVSDPESIHVKEEKEVNDDTKEASSVILDSVIVKEPAPERLRRKRQQVDPAKYVKILDDTGIKFKCTLCDTTYKWRKSLTCNKHWREKHIGVKLPAEPLATPDIYEINNKENDGKKVAACIPSFLSCKKETNCTPKHITCKEVMDTPVGNSNALIMPKIIGPFITDSCNTSNTSQDQKDALTGSPSAVTRSKLIGPFVLVAGGPIETSTPMNIQKNLVWSQTEDLHSSDVLTDEDDTKGTKENKTELDQSLEDSSVEKGAHETCNNLSSSKQIKCNMCDFIGKFPAELQKHSVSHSDERPFACMVCGLTYKWKWDLVKHFEKIHHTLPNPYKRRVSGQSKGTISISDSGDPFGTFHDTVSSDMIQPSKKQRLSDEDILSTKETRQSNVQVVNLLNNTDGHVNILRARVCNDPVVKLESNISSLNKESTEIFTHDTNNQIITYLPSTMSDVSKKIFMEPMKSPKEDQFEKQQHNSDDILRYKCSLCEYRARWPSDITQHTKNHFDEKPFHCPRCLYKSKWKWDVVKHLKRCGSGGGTVNDVIDTTKLQKISAGPPNAIVTVCGNLEQTTPKVTVAKEHVPSPTANIDFLQKSTMSDNVKLIQLLSGPVLNGDQNVFNDNDFKVHYSSDDSENDQLKQYSSTDLENTSFEGLQNLHHCLECPFIGHSIEELKQHSLLHSIDSSLTCDICGFCTREKGDLEKHFETYHCSSGQSQSDSEIIQASTQAINNDVESNMTSPTVSSNSECMYTYKCSHCGYVTSRKHVYELHLKINGCQRISQTSLTAYSNSQNADKLNCNKCSFVAKDLSTFLQHNLTHTSDQSLMAKSNGISKPSVQKKSFDAPFMKHRRKPVQQFKCSKCPYVCFKKSGLQLHSSMHEHRGENAWKCFYCDYNVFSKSLLNQHMRLHPEHRQNDGVEMYEESSEVGMVTKKVDVYKILDQNDCLIQLKYKMSYNCEWCDAVLPNVAHLYQHCNMVHNAELKNQETLMTAEIDENANHVLDVSSSEVFTEDQIVENANKVLDVSSSEVFTENQIGRNANNVLNVSSSEVFTENQIGRNANNVLNVSSSEVFTENQIDENADKVLDVSSSEVFTEDQIDENADKVLDVSSSEVFTEDQIGENAKYVLDVSSSEVFTEDQIDENANHVLDVSSSEVFTEDLGVRINGMEFSNMTKPQFASMLHSVASENIDDETSIPRKIRKVSDPCKTLTIPSAVTYLRDIELHGGNYKITRHFHKYRAYITSKYGRIHLDSHENSCENLYME